MEKLLHLYKYVDGVNDSPFPSKEQQATLYEFKYDAKRMGNAPTITGTLMHPLCLDELWGNNEVYVSYNGERYFIKQTPTSSYSNDDTRYKHECDFVSERVLLNDVYFYDVVTSDVSNDKPVSNSSNVVFYGDIHELAKRLNYSLQYAKLEYSVVVDEGITSESKLVSFQKQFFANVLQEGYKLFEIPYYFEGRVIHFGYTNNTIDKLFSYGAKDALLSISKNNITQRIINRITGVGSADNIPYYYPNFDPKGVSEVLYNGKANDLVSVENLIKYKKVKLGDTFIYNYESDKVIEYVDKSKYVVSKDITLLSENYETTKRYELVLDFPFSVDIAPNSSIIELNYSKSFLTNFKARLYRNLELRDTFTSFGETPYYRLIEGEYNFSISLEFTFGEFDEKTELTESDIPSIVDALTISITSDVSGFEQWTLNTANNIVKLNDYGLKLNTSPKNGDKITFKQLSYIPPQPNLMPPIYRETLGAERFYNALNNTYYDRIMGSYYSFDNLFMVGKNKEDDVLFEDIKPSIKGVTNSYYERIDMFSEFAWDENDNDEFDEEGNYLHPYFFGKLRLFDGEFGFNLFDHAIEEDEMVISMTSGRCGGCNFIIGVDNESQKNIVQVDEKGNLKRDANGNVLYGSPQERQNDTSKYEVWVALKKDIETFGVIMPNATNNYRPSAGDTFVILHIDLPNAYILAAEERLREELIKYMKENNSEKFNFSLSFSRIFFAENPTILAQLNENARIKIAYNNNAYTLYVSSYSYSMNADTALPEIRVELSEELAIVKESIVKQLANASLYLNKEVQRVNTSVATTNTTISKNTATAQASITKTNARVENVEKVVMNLQSNSGGGGGQGGINEEQLENYLTTNQYAKKSDIPSLDAYAKSDDVANTYATKSALKGVSDSVGTLRTDFDNLNALLNDDTSGVIDTWNEVVSFLDGYKDSEDLATILSGMNTDIANRVLIEDFEKLEEAVNPLFGYFDATGNANNALKLGGHTADYFASAKAVNTLTTDLSSLTSRVSINEQGIATNKTNIATLVGQVNGLANDVEILKGYWYIDDDGSLHTTYNIVVDKGGAFGKGSGGGGDVPSGGGIDEAQLWNILGTSGTQTIHSSHIPDLSGKYLSVNGGSITGSVSFNKSLTSEHWDVLTVNYRGSWSSYSNYVAGVRVTDGHDTVGRFGITYRGDNGGCFVVRDLYGAAGKELFKITATGKGELNGYEILHSNNYSDYALPLSGGRRYITSTDNITIDITTSTDHSLIALKNKDSKEVRVGYFGSYGAMFGYGDNYLSIKDDGTPTYNGNNLIHSGNIGSYNAGSATKLSDNTAYTAWGQTFFENGQPKNMSGSIDIGGGRVYWTELNNYFIGTAADAGIPPHGIYKFYGGHRFFTQNTESMRISYSGNVGIGTTGPQYKLDVNGSLNATTIYQNGTAIGSLAFKNSLVASDIPNLSWSKITSGKPTTLAGYGITDAIGTSGGTISSSQPNPLVVNSTYANSQLVEIALSYNNTQKGFIGYYVNGAYIGDSVTGYRIGVRQDGEPVYKLSWSGVEHVLYHTGNFNPADYLPLSGGRISGVVTISGVSEVSVPLSLLTPSAGNTGYIRFGSGTSSSNELGYLGFSAKGVPAMNYQGVVNTLIHSGNIGSYNAGSANYLSKSYANENVNYAKGSGVKMTYTTADGKNAPIYTSGLSVITDYGGWQMVSYATPTDSPNPYFRAMDSNGSYTVGWKQLAFLTDNVASATKLQTARTIWGQSFDGTGNVDGGISISQSSNTSFGTAISAYNSGIAVGQHYGFNFGYNANSRNYAWLSFYYAGNNSTENAVRLGISNSDVLSVTGNGNVLIGTTTDAGYKFTVNGGALANTVRTQELRLGEANPDGNVTQNKWYHATISYAYEDTSPNTLKPAIVFKSMYGTYSEGSGNELMRIRANGSVLIGASANYAQKLVVGGDVLFTKGITSSHWGALTLSYSGSWTSHRNYIAGIDTTDGTGLIGRYGVTYNGSVGVFVVRDMFCNGSYGASGVLMEVLGSGQTNIYGNLTVTGGGAFGSDIRYKDIISYRQLNLETIVNAPLFTFKWTDREDKEQHLGTSAQYWLGTQFKDAVNITNPKFYHLDYGALAVGIGISVAREVKGVKTEVQTLKEELSQVKKELKYYKELWQHSAQA